MTLGTLIIYIILGLGVTALILFPDFRKKLKIMCGGFLNLFIEDKARTLDGTRAIYQQAIEQAQEQYSKAHDMLQKVSGKYEIMKRDLSKAQAELKDIEAKCENLVKSGKIESAQVLSDRRDEVLVLIEQYNRALQDLIPMVNDAKMIATQKEQALRKLKSDSKRKIVELEMNQQMGEMFDEMDDLKKRNAVSKLLDSVDDGCTEARQKAVGARVVHENKLETKVGRALIEAKSSQSSDYIANLQKKYKTGERK